MARLTRFFAVLVVFFLLQGNVYAQSIEEMIGDMITAFSQSPKGVQDDNFREKVNIIDAHLHGKMEKDHDLEPFRKLIKTAREFSSRASARKMFEVVLEKAYKRLQFSRAQSDIGDSKTREEMENMIQVIEKYLDPSKADDDTVDRAGLEGKRKKLKEKMDKKLTSILKLSETERIVVKVTDEEGKPGKISATRETNLLAKLNGLAPNPEKLVVQISKKKDDLIDIHIVVNTFVAPTGFSVIEGEMDFVDVALSALDNNDKSYLDEVFGDNHFNTYRVVHSEEQLNVIPHGGNAAYEMGSLAPGQKWRLEFKKGDGISTILKELEGNTEIVVLNPKKAVSEKAIEFKNMGTRNLIYLQGTDVTGLVSVKAIGYLKPKDGHVSFKEALLITDDQLSSDLTRFVGEQGINFFLKRASDSLRTGLPFTPILENVACERDDQGTMVYIFTGRGKNKL